MAAPAHIARENGKKGGRPKGSTTRPQIRDYFNDEEIAELVTTLKERAKTDSTILKFLGEQIFGKAPQPLTGDKDNPIYIQGVEWERKDWRYAFLMGGRGSGRSGTASRFTISQLFGKEYTRGAIMRAVREDKEVHGDLPSRASIAVATRSDPAHHAMVPGSAGVHLSRIRWKPGHGVGQRARGGAQGLVCPHHPPDETGDPFSTSACVSAGLKCARLRR